MHTLFINEHTQTLPDPVLSTQSLQIQLQYCSNSVKTTDNLAGNVFSGRLQYVIVDEAHTVVQWQVHGMIYTVVVLVSQIFFLCRGETFRSILLRIEEIRSLIPEHAGNMALTATATERLRKDASRLMGLRNEVVVAISPCKDNIMYVVGESDGIERIFEPLATKLLKKQASYPRTLIYCRSFADCSNVYSLF